MTTNAQVREAWRDLVFAALPGAGVNAFDNQVLPETRRERKSCMLNKRIDYWQYIVSNVPTPGMLGAEIQSFEVQVTRVIQKDADNAAFNEVLDDISEALYDKVKTGLGDTWNGTVQQWDPPAGQPKVVEDNFGEERVWKCTVVYKAQNQVNY